MQKCEINVIPISLKRDLVLILSVLKLKHIIYRLRSILHFFNRGRCISIEIICYYLLNGTPYDNMDFTYRCHFVRLLIVLLFILYFVEWVGGAGSYTYDKISPVGGSFQSV